MAYIWFKTELSLNQQQKQIIDNGIVVQRQMWNYLVENINPLVKEKKININIYGRELEKELRIHFKEQYAKTGLGTRMVRSVVDRYVKAWKYFFKHSTTKNKPPVFHSRYKSEQSLSFVGSTSDIKDGYFTLSLRTKGTKGFEEFPPPYRKPDVRLKLMENTKHSNLFSSYRNLKAKQNTIIKRRHRYFLYINYECDIIEQPSGEKEIGLDWGLKDYFIDSDGNKHNIPKSAKRQLQRIKQLNRVLSKKTKGSNNYMKVVNKINDAWFRYNNIKKDYIEKFTLGLFRTHRLIVCEDLDLIEMRAKTHKSRRQQMNHNSYSSTRLRLEQKAKKFPNCQLVFVDRCFPSSQLCSNCGRNTGKKPVSIREFVCPYCGVKHDRDVNAAKNILHEGKRMLSNG